MTTPRDLRIVGLLWIVGGVGAILSPIVTGRLELGTGLLAVPAGIGLLRFRNGWRVLTLVSLWVSFIVTAIFLPVWLVSPRFSLSVFGWRSDSKLLALGLLGVVFAFALWQYRVLTRPAVRELFTGKRAEAV